MIDYNTLILEPDEDLEHDKLYKVSIDNEVAWAGDSSVTLESPYEFNFKTGKDWSTLFIVFGS